jgi:hypothetical protein
MRVLLALYLLALLAILLAVRNDCARNNVGNCSFTLGTMG